MSVIITAYIIDFQWRNTEICKSGLFIRPMQIIKQAPERLLNSSKSKDTTEPNRYLDDHF